MHACMHTYIHTYIRSKGGCEWMREMGGAPRNLAPRNHLLVWIVQPTIRLPLHRWALDKQSTED